MTEKLTKRESKITDLFLEFLLTLDKSYAFKTTVYFFFNKEKLPKERVIVICKYLERKNLISIVLDNNEELRNINFDKSNILSFLKHDSINKLWTYERKLYNDSKLSEWQVKTFWWFFSFAIAGTALSIYNFIDNIYFSKRTIQQEQRIEQMESELTKLQTSILNKKNTDSLRNSMELTKKIDK